MRKIHLDIPSLFGILGFGPWIYDVWLHPQEVPYSSWFVWALLCFSLGIATKLQGKNEPIWFVWAIGDVVVIILTYILGGRNWAVESYLALLIPTGIALLFVLSYGQKKPKLAEFLISFVFMVGYIPQWFQQRHEFAIGVFLAMVCGIFAASITAYQTYKQGKGIGYGIIVTIVCPLVLVIQLFFGKQNTRNAGILTFYLSNIKSFFYGFSYIIYY